MATKICPKCGMEREARGFTFHVKYCKGTLNIPEEQIKKVEEIKKEVEVKTKTKDTELPKEMPGLSVTYSLMDDLQEEVKRTKEMQDAERVKVEKAEECNCEGYEGQSFNCPVHKAKVECPNCHCIDTVEKPPLGYMEPCQSYRCTMCGFAFQRNMVTGDYLYG